MIRAWIIAHEKWAGGVAFLLDPRAMADKWKRWILFWSHRERDKAVVEELKRKIPPMGFARIWALLSLAIIVASWAGWAWLAVTDHREIAELKRELAKYRTDTVTETQVSILGRLEDGDYSYVSKEEPKGGAFRPCQADIKNGLDVNAILTQAAAGKFVADYASWEERGVCKSILRADLGFWWRDRNTNFGYVKVADTKER